MHKIDYRPLAWPRIDNLPLVDLLGSLSFALDMTEGQPEGHCLRAAMIGTRIGTELGLPAERMADLFFALMLKDLGCSSNAARICELYLTDDLSFKSDYKTIGDSLPSVLSFVLNHTGMKSGMAERFRAIINIVQNGGQISRELIETRCQRGASIARKLRFSDQVSEAILALDEHWNGQGKPLGLKGEAIPLFARIALLAQVVDVFFVASGPAGALAEVRWRSGRWFDPKLVSIFERIAADPAFWTGLTDPAFQDHASLIYPGDNRRAVDESYLDDIAAAFADVVDSKSPYTSGHCQRVALFADMIGEEIGMGDHDRRWLNRAALLHDIGKLGVSNSILDKPAKLDDEEWVAMREHAALSRVILSRISDFSSVAEIGGSHHERLDGKGYPQGLTASRIDFETRIVTCADIFDALTAERPYRGPMPAAKAFDILDAQAGEAVDPRCIAALKSALARVERDKERQSSG